MITLHGKQPTVALVPNSVHPYRGSRAVGSLGPVSVAGLVQAGRWAQVCSGASPGICSCHGGARVCRVANTTRAQVKPPAGRGLCLSTCVPLAEASHTTKVKDSGEACPTFRSRGRMRRKNREQMMPSVMPSFTSC